MRPSGPACILFAVAATAIAWGGVPWGTFQFDDLRNVVLDPATTDAAALLERLPHGLRPLTRLSYFVDAQFYGLDAAGFLSTDLLLHAITVLLVFALARSRLDLTGACAAALVFCVQPANAEVIAYVSGRSTGLMVPLLLGGLLLHERGKPLPALALFSLACLAKEHALVFPALVLAWELTRGDVRASALRRVAPAALAGTVLIALLFAFSNFRALLSHALWDRSIVDNLLVNGRAMPTMLSLWVRPWALSADHAFDPRLHLAASIAGIAFVLSAAVVALAVRPRYPLVSLAILWSLIALLPTNSVLAKPDPVTEKPLYLAWVGPSIAFGAAFAALLAMTAHRAARRVFLCAAGLLVCALVGASAWRASIWRDPVALWTDAAEKAPDKARCWNNLGMAYLAVEREGNAIAAFERAVFLDPRDEYAAMNLVIARTLCGRECRR